MRSTIQLFVLFTLLAVGAFAQAPDFQTVNSASFNPSGNVGLVTAFQGTARILTNHRAEAQSQPLPRRLAGCQVFVNGEAAPLLFVSPGQINFQIEPQWRGKRVSVEIHGSGGQVTFANATIGVNPGLFTAGGNGQGALAAVTTTDGVTFASAFQFNADGRPVPAPVFTGGADVYLILFGTGISGQGTVTATVGGVPARVVFSGAQGDFAGLDQVNLIIPRGLASGPHAVKITVGGVESNAGTIAIQ